MKKGVYVLLLIIFFLLFTLSSFIGLYEKRYQNRVYPGVMIGDTVVAAKTKEEIRRLFEAKNASLGHVSFTFTFEEKAATVSASQIGLGYNATLLTEQAFIIGRTGNVFADTFHKGLGVVGKIPLSPSFSLNRTALEKALFPLANDINIAPIDAVFEMRGNRVIAFQSSVEGQAIDISKIEDIILKQMTDILKEEVSSFHIALPVKKLKPKVSLADINNLGIREHIGQGTSTFRGSPTNRVHNIILSASRINGTIVKPDGVFSFNDAVGDVSKLTGYKEAFIIKEGKTILGDGGGVCQVSTTLFRAILNTGLPIVERHPHSYRVVYYEQDKQPGLDATVYAPSVDLKFKNDTLFSILIIASVDAERFTISFDFYGTSDGRVVELTPPVIKNQTPPPDDLYIDDPTLPVGSVKQVERRIPGAQVSFDRTVRRNGEVILSATFDSRYQPWQAVFLRGTRE